MDISQFDAMRIAKTEQHRTIAEARAESFDDTQSEASDLGLNVEKVWIATSDGRVRPEHLAMNGAVSHKGLFDFLGMQVEEPGMIGLAEHDIQCRCTSGVVLV